MLRIFSAALDWAFPVALLALTVYTAWTADPANRFFLVFFLYKYPRAIFHQYAYTLWSKPSPIPENPSYSSQDVTVIIPTIDPENEDFAECMTTVLNNRPGEMLIVTVGHKMLTTLDRIMAPYRASYPDTKIRTCYTTEPNKRRQVCSVLPFVKTEFTLLLDDHVFWPSTNFLQAIVAPFEDPKIGGVATVKKVRRTAPGHFNWKAFWNFLGCVYLERHNFEIQATNAIDQGVFVISGRTAVYRTHIISSSSFIHSFCNEMFFFGKYGPLNADDDNFITRELVKAGWKIKVQNHPDAFIETTVGTYPKFIDQCKRWARTTWRSNPASMFTDDGSTWWKQPWTTWGVFVYTCFNFSAFIEIGMFYGLYTSTWWSDASTTRECLYMVVALMLWIMVFKMQKLAQFFREHPKDILMFFPYLVWTWYHSYIKTLSLFTFFDVVWGGRDLSKFGPGVGNSASSAAGSGPSEIPSWNRPSPVMPFSLAAAAGLCAEDPKEKTE